MIIADDLSPIIRAALKTSPPSEAEERDLIARAKTGDLAARAKLVDGHMRWVVANARRFAAGARRRGVHVDLEDLVHEGVLGLLHAVDRFELSRGVRLLALATPWIRQSIARYFNNTGHLVRVPVHALEQLRVARANGTAIGGRYAVDVERAASAPAYLDAPISDDFEATLGDQLADPRPGPEELTAEAQLERRRRDAVARAVETLKPREQVIARRRLMGGESLAEVAPSLGARSREWSRLVERDAKDKLSKVPALIAVAREEGILNTVNITTTKPIDRRFRLGGRELVQARASELLAVDPRIFGRVLSLEAAPPASSAAAKDVAIVHVRGPLAQRAIDELCGYVDGYDAVTARFVAALNSPKVASVVLAIDSPGGDVAGLEEAIRRMADARDRAGKPVLAYVDELAASAAYWLAAVVAKDGIFLPAAGSVGSIGTLAALVDETKGLEAEGIKVTLVRSPAGKAAGHPAGPIEDVALARLEDLVARSTDRFIAAIAGARRIDAQAIRALDGAIRTGPAAVDARLADGIDTLEGVVARAATRAKGGAKPPAARAVVAGDRDLLRARAIAELCAAGREITGAALEAYVDARADFLRDVTTTTAPAPRATTAPIPSPTPAAANDTITIPGDRARAENLVPRRAKISEREAERLRAQGQDPRRIAELRAQMDPRADLEMPEPITLAVTSADKARAASDRMQLADVVIARVRRERAGWQ